MLLIHPEIEAKVQIPVTPLLHLALRLQLLQLKLSELKQINGGN